jgi:hypothetical protein
LCAAVGLPYRRVDTATELPGALKGSGIRLAEVRTDRAEGAKLRAVIAEACASALAQLD